MKILSYIYLMMLLCSSIAFSKNYSASIAINPKTGITGFTRNFNIEAEAIKTAIIRCNKNNKMKSGCKKAVHFSNGCGAVAWSSALKIANGDFTDSNLDLAKKGAIHDCRNRGASDCKIVQAFCTSWDTIESTLIWW